MVDSDGGPVGRSGGIQAVRAWVGGGESTTAESVRSGVPLNCGSYCCAIGIIAKAERSPPTLVSKPYILQPCLTDETAPLVWSSSTGKELLNLSKEARHIVGNKSRAHLG